MRLINVLDSTNTLEKNSFYKILEQIVEENRSVEVEEILSSNNRELKNIDNENVAKLFNVVREDYKCLVEGVLENSLSQLDVLIDILIKDGNCLMSREWFLKLYSEAIKTLEGQVKVFNKLIDEEDKNFEQTRLRDYKIYRRCTKVAYENDQQNNQDFKITHDEYSILKELGKSLGLSNHEVRLINYHILSIEKRDIDDIIKDLKELGILFYSKKNYTVYVPDEMVRMLREIRGKFIADKYFRRILLGLKDSVVNMVAKKHNIDRKLDRKDKINSIVNEGISIFDCLSSDIFREDISISDRKKEINEIMITHGIASKGATIDEKIMLIVDHFSAVEDDERVGISNEGYQSLVTDLMTFLPSVNNLVKEEFQLQQDNVLNCDLLLNYNIKPLDVLELITKEDLKEFADQKAIKTRGDIVKNILENYTDSENLMLENYVHIGNRDLNELKNNNIDLASTDFGLKYEELTKVMFQDLGFNVDEELRQTINTSKDKIDILLNIGNNEVIIVECKTAKSSSYNKFSSVTRQIKSYHKNATLQGLRVMKTLLVAPDFSEDFVLNCEMDLELNLSLITSDVMFNIWEGFKEAKHQIFPVNLLMRDVLIDDVKILRALKVIK